MLKALATAPGDYVTPDTKHSSFKARTTGVSNPVRSPSFRASASVFGWFPAYALGVPFDINAFHCYTESSRNPAKPLVRSSQIDDEVKLRHLRLDASDRLRDPLRPVNPDNACILRITATAGT